MKSNHLLVGLAIVVLGGAAWLATSFLGGRPDALEKELAPSQPSAAAAPVESLEGGDSEDTSARELAPREMPLAPTVSASQPWAGELGGMIGRVVEEDGTPVVGISVALAQVDANLMLAGDWAALGEAPPKLVLEETQTNAEGRFRLGGASDAAFQGLGVDLGGPRATLRIVDMQLHHGEVTDFGDIVLPAGCTVAGRVVDEQGQPVAGARVRLFPVPPGENLEMVHQVGVQDFRSDCSVGISRMINDGVDSPVIELPAMLRNQIDRLPIPTDFTDADGAYRFVGVPVADLIQGVDKADWWGVSRTVTATPGEVVLDDAVLRVGRTIEGVVVDEEGEPLEGIDVIAGSEIFGEGAILHPAGRTGADGRFSLAGCPDSGAVMVCARRFPDEPWVGVVDAGNRAIEVELESAITVTVRVVDTAGAPVGGARVELAPGSDKQSPMGVLARFMFLGSERAPLRFVEGEAGVYVCEQVTPGRYEVRAMPTAHAPARQQLELWEGEAELTLTCEPAEWLELTVIDSHTNLGVANARASVVGPGFPFMSALAVGRTGSDGRVRLGPFTLNRETGGGMGFGSGEESQVLVQHPRYADTSAAIEQGTTEVAVALDKGGEILGQIQWGASAPQSIYMLMVERRDGDDGVMEAFLPPRFGRSGIDGSFRFSNLPPGKYRVGVYDQFFDRDPLELMLLQEEPTLVHRSEGVEVEAGKATEIDINLSSSGRGQTARIAGSVYVDMQPIAGADVRVFGPGPSVRVQTDGLGNFETPDFLALGDVTVRIQGDVETSSGERKGVQLYNDSVTPVAQSVVRLDVDLSSQRLIVSVLGPDGQGIAGARVDARSASGGSNWNERADNTGRAEVTLIGAGEFIITTSHEGYAKSSERIDLGAEDFTGELELTLTTSVPCAGVCDLGAFEGAASNGGAYLRITGGSDGGSWRQLDQEDLADDQRAAFRVDGLQPGSYEAQLWYNGNQGEAIPFELAAGGDENLFFVFQPRQSGR